MNRPSDQTKPAVSSAFERTSLYPASRVHIFGVWAGVLLFSRQLTRVSAKLRPQTRKTFSFLTSISVPLNTPTCTKSMHLLPFHLFRAEERAQKENKPNLFHIWFVTRVCLPVIISRSMGEVRVSTKILPLNVVLSAFILLLLIILKIGVSNKRITVLLFSWSILH